MTFGVYKILNLSIIDPSCNKADINTIICDVFMQITFLTKPQSEIHYILFYTNNLSTKLQSKLSYTQFYAHNFLTKLQSKLSHTQFYTHNFLTKP